MGREKFTIDFVRKTIEADGSKLLSTEYINTFGYLYIECPEKHTYKMQFCNLRSGHRCPVCAKTQRANTHRTKISDIKELVENAGYRLISTEYKSDKTIVVKCPNPEHTEYEVNLFSFKKGRRCQQCWYERMGGRDRLKYDYVKNSIESVSGYKLLSTEYRRNNLKLDIQCPEGHNFKMRFNNFQQGQRCPLCIPMYSKVEKEVLAYVQSIYHGPILENDRTVILNNLTGRFLELDIWLPELHFAIEYNGLYWHQFEERSNNDLIKLEECKKQGITLMIIMEHEWEIDQAAVKERIHRIVGLHPYSNML